MTAILVMGGAHIDRRGRIAGETVAAASNPGTWKEEAGGGAFNAARSLSRLGHAVTLISPRGGDSEGEAVSLAAAAAGIVDRPFTFLDRRTPSYTAILTRDGDLVIAVADMDLYTLFSPRRLSIRAVRDAVDASDLLLIDANLPAPTLKAIGDLARSQGKRLAGIGISPAKVTRYRGMLDRVDFLFMNEAEARALSGTAVTDFRQWPVVLRQAGLAGGVVTRGREAVIGWHGAQSAWLVPPPLEAIGDVTGAGDGFAAGFLHGMLGSGDLLEALSLGAASARLALSSEMAVAEDLSRDLLARTLALVPAAEIVL
jgi:sugar/nucleoside kinase (ribokinase family)